MRVFQKFSQIISLKMTNFDHFEWKQLSFCEGAQLEINHVIQQPTAWTNVDLLWYQFSKTSMSFFFRYQGNPDLLPIRSDEFTFLVRTLHLLSGWINTQFSKNIHEAYHRNNYLGTIHILRKHLYSTKLNLSSNISQKLFFLSILKFGKFFML